MTDAFKNLRSLMSMMGNREEIQARFDQMQAELANKTVQAEAGAGAVRATVNGKMEVVGIDLDSVMIAALTGGEADDDKAMMEELILSAVNEAMRRAQELVREEMTHMAGGINLPGLDNLLRGD